MSNIIQDYVILINDVLEEYNSAKSILKKKKAKNHLKEVERMINKLTNNRTMISTKIISDYAWVLSSNGLTRYRSCSKCIINQDNNGVAIFDIGINHDESVVVTICPLEQNSDSCFVNYTYSVCPDNKSSFIDENVKFLVYTASTEYSDDIDGKFRYIKDYAAKIIISDIDTYLRDLLLKGYKDE